MRKTNLSLVVAAGLSLALLPGYTFGQVVDNRGVGYVPQGYTTGNGWTGYAPASPWQGYYPGSPWTGYLPPAGTVQPAVPAQPGYTTQPVQPEYVYQNVAPATVAVRTPTRQSTAPAFYREYGTGRNVYLHKPWSPK